MHWRTRFSKVKHSLGAARNQSMKVLSVADRAHALLSKGFNHLGDRLEPEVREKFDGSLQSYGRRSRQINNLDTNVKEIDRQVRETFPEFYAN